MLRRKFLKRSAGAVAGIAAPALVGPGHVLGANEKVRMGFMGVGGRGGSIMKGFAELPEVDAVVLCDIDSNRIPKAVDEVTQRQKGKKPQVVKDFRRLLDDKRIDAMTVGTPDHWHALGTIMACQAGKDVYVEKPPSHNIREGQLMLQAARKYGRVVQVGIQSRSQRHHAEAYEFIRSGKLGKVVFAKAWESARQSDLGFPTDQPVPDGVDYDTWLGPAPERPFNPVRFHGRWRWFFDYGTGDLGNDGVHRLDYAIRGLNAGLEGQGKKPTTYPLAAASSGGKFVFDDCQEWPDTLYTTLDYEGATLVYEMRIWSKYPLEGVSEGAAIYGENGYVVIGNLSWRAFGPDDEPWIVGGSSTNKQAAPAHKRNFLECVRTRETPNCDLGIAMHTNVACHMGNAAWRANKKLQFNPNTFTLGPDAEDNKWTTRTYRKKWSLPVTI
ncbi:MAG: Gfo/Idh/MocA family oxidoreductase [Planctomycetes bacterium]|nr:Gfo/Idh/MocA family oxidoreductase [Planctomycetota bacterium]